MQKLYFYITALLLFVHISCSSPGYYKTARITDRSIESVIGMSISAHESFSNDGVRHGEKDTRAYGRLAQFEFSNWVRLSKNHDLGVSLIGILGGIQTTLRQHLHQQSGVFPEVTVGISYGHYSFGYTALYQEERGVPLYLSWNLKKEHEFYLVYEPKQFLFYQNDGNHMRSFGYQTAQGIRMDHLFLEHSYSFIDPRFNQHNFSIGFRLSD